ncbi:SLOG family protein (plasmid) [Azospirillum sp. HJ39]|uniref:SLOG family protein n=1 Tax=Azospirillum sp. HJ39 TaxID=3159496 RepID=UPI0035570E73
MIVAGTGHRPQKLGGFGRATQARLLMLASCWLTARPDVTRVISGMALGWDLALAHTAVLAGIPFTAAVPCDAQESRWPAPSQAYYRRLLTLSDDVVVVSPGGYEPWKMQVRNEWMVDRCDLLLALWDGSRGGTANCCWYSERVERPIENLWDEWLRLNDSDSRLASSDRQ